MFRPGFATATAAFFLASHAALADPPADPAPADTASIWTLRGENASVTLARLTDRMYTDGLELGWMSPAGKVPGALTTLGDTLCGPGQQRIGIDLSQQIYTPANTELSIPDPHGRPYAGYLSANLSLLSDTDTTRSVLMLSLGVIGPAAGGALVQNRFHDLIGQQHDRGWSGQIPNSPAIEVLSERTWRLPLTRFGGLETDFLPALTAGVGTVRDYAQLGVSIRLGQGLDSDFGIPRVRPGLSGGDVFVPTRPFAWYVFAGVDGQAVGYDMLLQSAPFRSGPHVDAVWDVAEFQAGFAMMAHGVRLTLAWVAQTQEFKGQTGGLHQFGVASVSVRF
jgi:lipid A 3-O-deacylase